jgi:hypothetical protein
MKKITFLLVVPAVLFSCNPKPQANTSVVGDAAFQKLSDDYLSGYLAWRPATGVALGFHEYDGKVTDASKTSIDKELARLKDFDQKLSATDTASLSKPMFYDFRILRSAIKEEIFSFEDIGEFDKNPMTYAGALDVSIYVKRNFSPLETRIKSIIAIEKTAPQLFAAAKANLKDSLAKPYIQTAIEIAHGSVAFLNGDLKVALKDVKNDTLMKAFNSANQTALNAINDFAT